MMKITNFAVNCNIAKTWTLSEIHPSKSTALKLGVI